jgi:hypothetical protein
MYGRAGLKWRWKNEDGMQKTDHGRDIEFRAEMHGNR